MLIAFALAVSGMLFSWIYQFIYGQREELQFCSSAQISLNRAYYNPQTGNINMIVYNTGGIPLTGFVVLVTKEKTTETARDFSAREILSGNVGLFPISYSDDIRTVVVQSIQCRNAQDMIGIYNVEGL